MNKKQIKNYLSQAKHQVSIDSEDIHEIRENVADYVYEYMPKNVNYFRFSFVHLVATILVFAVIGTGALASTDIDISSPLYPLKYNAEEIVIKTAPQKIKSRLQQNIIRKRLIKLERALQSDKKINIKTKEKILNSATIYIQKADKKQLEQAISIIKKYDEKDREKIINRLEKIEKKMIDSPHISPEQKKDIQNKFKKARKILRSKLKEKEKTNINYLKIKTKSNSGNNKINIEKNINNGQIKSQIYIKSTGSSSQIKLQQKINSQSNISIKKRNTIKTQDSIDK